MDKELSGEKMGAALGLKKLQFEDLALLESLKEGFQNSLSESALQSPDRVSIESALRAFDFLKALELVPVAVNRSEENAIGFTFEAGAKFGYAEFDNDGEAVFLLDTNGKNRESWSFDSRHIPKLEAALKRIKAHLLSR